MRLPRQVLVGSFVFLATALASALGCTPKSATAAEPSAPVVVELFTSEGCSSCPPADDVLAALGRGEAKPGAPTVVPLAFHVDYWDELGWKDPYSSVEWTRRQREYGRAANRSGLFTPEVVVDGRDSLNGSNATNVARAIARAAAAPKARVTATVRTDVGGERRIGIQVGPLPRGTGVADAVVLVVEDDVKVTVSRGENAGKTLHHTAIVKSLKRAGVAESAGTTLEAPLSPLGSKKERYVVIVQERGTRAIVGAAVLPT